MKDNFELRLIYKVGKYKMYYAERIIKKGHNKFKFVGTLTIRPSGVPNTAYAVFYKICLNYNNAELGFYMSKHFNNKNAWMSAKCWLNWLLNNSPDYYGDYRKNLRIKNG